MAAAAPAIKKEPLYHFIGLNNKGDYSFDYNYETGYTLLLIKIDQVREKIFRFMLEPQQEFRRSEIPDFFAHLSILDSRDLEALVHELEKMKVKNFETTIKEMINLTYESGRNSKNGATRVYFWSVHMQTLSVRVMQGRMEAKQYASEYISERSGLRKRPFQDHPHFFKYHSPNNFLGFLTDTSRIGDPKEAIENALWFKQHPHHQKVVALLRMVVIDEKSGEWLAQNHGTLAGEVYDAYQDLIKNKFMRIRVIMDHLNWPESQKFSPQLQDHEILQSVEQHWDDELGFHQLKFQDQIPAILQNKA